MSQCLSLSLTRREFIQVCLAVFRVRAVVWAQVGLIPSLCSDSVPICLSPRGAWFPTWEPVPWPIAPSSALLTKSKYLIPQLRSVLLFVDSRHAYKDFLHCCRSLKLGGGLRSCFWILLSLGKQAEAQVQVVDHWLQTPGPSLLAELLDVHTGWPLLCQPLPAPFVKPFHLKTGLLRRVVLV